jgi:poly(A) polymerase
MDAADSLRLRLPPAVSECIRRLRAGGGRPWIVGGAVRDGLLGESTSDWDLAVDRPPEAWWELFPEAMARDLGLGALHWTVEGLDIAVTAMREEGGYQDHRHPDWVRWTGDPARDAVRRDFTVNALYLDPEGGGLLDPCGGLPDLRHCRLRMIGEPAARLREDPLRILRGIRQAAQCRLQLAPGLLPELRARAADLTTLSPERVYQELTGILCGRGRGRGLRLLFATGAIEVLLPELTSLSGVPHPPDFHPEGDVLTHVCLVLEQVAAGDPVQGWSALLHDSGKPKTFERADGRIRFHGHDTLSAEIAEAVLRRLRAPRELRERVVAICRDHIRFASLPQMAGRKRDRWLRDPDFRSHLEFHRADCLASHGKLDVYAAAVAALAALPPLPPPPLCSGRDALALGLAPGPQIGELLRELETLLEARGITDRSAALALLQQLVTARIKGCPGPADRAGGGHG